MTLTVSEYSLLSLDSYNRPFNPDFGPVPLGAELLPGGIEDFFGFGAAAYRIDGEIIISFCGTNQLLLNDPFFGWPLADGMATAPQAILAIQFYKSTLALLEPGEAEHVTFVGHSLGGGLAGYMGAIYQKPAQLFDHMPFTEGANNCYQYALGGDEVDENGNPIDPVAAAWREFVYGDQPIPEPNFNQIAALHISGEILESLRNGDGQQSTAIDIPIGADLPDSPIIGEAEIRIVRVC